MAPVFQNISNPEFETFITSSDVMGLSYRFIGFDAGQLYSPSISWDWRVTDLETAQDLDNAKELPLSALNTSSLVSPNHALEKEHFPSRISPRSLHSLTARDSNSADSCSDPFCIVMAVVFSLFGVIIALALLWFIFEMFKAAVHEIVKKCKKLSCRRRRRADSTARPIELPPIPPTRSETVLPPCSENALPAYSQSAIVLPVNPEPTLVQYVPAR